MTVLDVQPVPIAKPRRWTKAEFYALADGPWEGKRKYLYRGELIDMPAMGALHVAGLTNAEDWCHDTLRPEYRVRGQCPLELPDETVPQPDVAVVTHDQHARLPHPNVAVLLIELADSSIELDREMAFDYASTRSPEYWLLNMRDREVEVYRDPVPDPASPTGLRYAAHRVYRDGESLAPLAKPVAVVAVAILVRTGS